MKTNNLIFNIDKIVGNEHIFVKIRLNDECKNGHQDFAITGDIYTAGKPKINKYCQAGGCIHEDILKHFPQFKTFVDLHLCDYKGIPMHPVANGFYHLKEGFNKTKPESPDFANQYCDYYRITLDQFNVLKTSINKVFYYLNLKKLGILDQWEAQANKAIKELERLTGDTFVVDSKRTQLTEPTPQEIKKELRRLKSGYYSAESIKKREGQAAKKELLKLKQEWKKEQDKAKLEFKVKTEVLKKGGKKALDNIIFYNHSNTLSFNWRGYDKLSADFLNNFIPTLELPVGVKVEIK